MSTCIEVEQTPTCKNLLFLRLQKIFRNQPSHTHTLAFSLGRSPLESATFLTSYSMDGLVGRWWSDDSLWRLMPACRVWSFVAGGLCGPLGTCFCCSQFPVSTAPTRLVSGFLIPAPDYAASLRSWTNRLTVELGAAV